MVKYSSRNSIPIVWQWTLVLIFALCSLVFLVLPLFRSPVQDIWRWVSVSAGSILSDTVVVNTHNTCIVIAIPPHASFDTVLLECSSADNISEDNFVWFVEGADRYLVGKVTSAHNSRVVARMFTTSIATQPLGVRFAGFPERYSAVPLGGGSLRVEVPGEVDIKVGDQVRHAVSNQLFGVVSGVNIEKGSYIKRVYIRLPFSFEKLTQLEVR